ncbi:Kelch-like protein 8 [Acipenser ruthenus]|uniref:Kelch-like protein 8 n=1 Tax=Acipenser ruthenus TaxID=7906 RepID=A0A662YKV6_ACIRT|nr:Kelch-like protein 8 [Acipenser ruthenus]
MALCVGDLQTNGWYINGGFDDNSPLSSVERFDPRTNCWEYVAELTTPRGGVGVATIMGKIFAVGGHNGNVYLNTVEAYDPVLNRSKIKSYMSKECSSFAQSQT